MDAAVFFDHVKHTLFAGRISESQVDGLSRILAYQQAHYPDMGKAQLAYVMASATWESARVLQPVQEDGSPEYLRSKPYWPFIGEGLIQVTWRANYLKFGATKPGDLLQWPQALRALFDGMMKGMFTGHSLPDYVGANGEHCDFLNARRVVNGLDKASVIKMIAESYLSALAAADR